MSDPPLNRQQTIYSNRSFLYISFIFSCYRNQCDCVRWLRNVVSNAFHKVSKKGNCSILSHHFVSTIYIQLTLIHAFRICRMSTLCCKLCCHFVNHTQKNLDAASHRPIRLRVDHWYCCAIDWQYGAKSIRILPGLSVPGTDFARK